MKIEVRNPQVIQEIGSLQPGDVFRVSAVGYFMKTGQAIPRSDGIGFGCINLSTGDVEYFEEAFAVYLVKATLIIEQ